MFWLRWLPSLSVIHTAPGRGAGVAAWAAPAMLPEAISATKAAAVTLRAVVRAGRLRGSAFMVRSSWGMSGPPRGRSRSVGHTLIGFLTNRHQTVDNANSFLTNRQQHLEDAYELAAIPSPHARAAT